MSKLSLTVNAWSVEWDVDGRRRPAPCEVKANCAGTISKGVATFTENGKLVVVGGFVNPSCCRACAVGHTMREGLAGTITIKHIAELLVGSPR